MALHEQSPRDMGEQSGAAPAGRNATGVSDEGATNSRGASCWERAHVGDVGDSRRRCLWGRSDDVHRPYNEPAVGQLAAARHILVHLIGGKDRHDRDACKRTVASTVSLTCAKQRVEMLFF